VILKITNGSATNPQTIDLSPYVDVADGDGFDIADPEMSTKIWGKSLLKPGATEALEQNVEREIAIPLKIGPIGGVGLSSLTQVLQFVGLGNQIIRSPGAVMEWQPDLASQPTYYDALSGQIDVEYRFRAEQQSWVMAKLRFFAYPFGRPAAPRAYAAASGVGPLLLISPYASGGALTVSASTQAGIAGFGGKPLGASSGVFYWGNPSLAGDAPAQLQISYVGPLPNNATNTGCAPFVAVSLLPDPLYRPLVTVPEISAPNSAVKKSSTAVASQYITSIGQDLLSFTPIAGPMTSTPSAPATNWAGDHRLFAIARSSSHPGYLQTQVNVFVGHATTASVTSADWGLYDLGTFTIRPSAYPANAGVNIALNQPSGGAMDVTALVMLPDSATWFLSPQQLQPSQLGWPNAIAQFVATTNYTNTFLLDDVLGDQFMYYGQSQTSAPPPLAGAGQQGGTLMQSNRITQYTRGLVPTPDPKNGLPTIAILGLAQNFTPSGTYVSITGTQPVPGASWANPQNLHTFGQVNVLERTRFELP
jgi:hypothetical protein